MISKPPPRHPIGKAVLSLTLLLLIVITPSCARGRYIVADPPTVDCQRAKLDKDATDLNPPERFVKGESVPAHLPAAVWINPPNANLH